MKKTNAAQMEELEDMAEAFEEDGKETSAKPSRKSQTVMVPRIQNMDDYMLRHYKKYIIKELNQRLVDGKIESLVGVPVKSERILPGECCFQHFNYWRLNRTDMWVQIDLRIELRVQTSVGVDTDFPGSMLFSGFPLQTRKVMKSASLKN